MKKTTFKAGLKELLTLADEKPSLTIKEVFDSLSGKNRLLVLIFLSLPFCQPIPLPGVSTPFGIVVMFIGLRYAFSKKIWFPKYILKKRISSKTVKKMAHKGIKLMGKLRPLIHSRGRFLMHNLDILHGLTFCLMGLLLSLPLPIPFSNMVAGWAILLISIGLLENDGLFVGIGYFVALLTVIFFAALLVINIEFFRRS